MAVVPAVIGSGTAVPQQQTFGGEPVTGHRPYMGGQGAVVTTDQAHGWVGEPQARPAHLCDGTKANGDPCGANKAKGTNLCAGHLRSLEAHLESEDG